jgi:hypothetical protein
MSYCQQIEHNCRNKTGSEQTKRKNSSSADSEDGQSVDL